MNLRILLALAAAAVCLRQSSASAKAELDASRIQEISASLPARPVGFGSPISDREAWQRLGSLASFASAVSNAEQIAATPVEALPDELYLDYSRTGNRDRCQKVMFARSARLVGLTCGECIENQGHFLDPLRKTVEAVCAERTWVYPAHDGSLNNFYGRTVDIDLRASAVATELGTVDYLLGDKLPPATRRLIHENVQRRIFTPFRDMVEGRRPEIHWMRATHNWNAVCLAGVTGAALALEDRRDERAWFVAAAEYYISYYLKSFTPDGYCSEGVGYWNYGFGHFLTLGEAIRQATGGRDDLLALPSALQPALFQSRSQIINGVYLTISDCHPGARPNSEYVWYINQRLGINGQERSSSEFAKPYQSLAETMLFAFLPTPLPRIAHPAIQKDSAARSWFKEGGVLICRNEPAAAPAFGVALKGGHNAENHNHNDVGSFSVVCGKTMLICDPGAEVYTARTFGAHRYESKVINSYGHAVPVVDGELQRPGAEARAAVLRSGFHDTEDILAMDISSAYGVADLKRLVRTFTFRRGPEPALVVEDQVAFGRPGQFESALITWGKWKMISEHALSITDGDEAVRVEINTGGLPFKVTDQEINEDVTTPRKPWHLAITLQSPIKEAVVKLTITPQPGRAARN